MLGNLPTEDGSATVDMYGKLLSLWPGMEAEEVQMLSVA